MQNQIIQETKIREQAPKKLWWVFLLLLFIWKFGAGEAGLRIISGANELRAIFSFPFTPKYSKKLSGLQKIKCKLKSSFINQW